MEIGAIDRVITQQALIVGRVTDALTGGATLRPATVRLLYQTPAGAPERPYPLAAHTYPDGLFVVPGNPDSAFPRLTGGQTLALRLTASAAGYQAGQVDFTLSAAQVAPASQVRHIAGRDLSMPLLAAPLLTQDIALSPTPIHLSGRVVRADDPAIPITGAQVRVTEPSARGPATTDADGFFTLLDMPVAGQVTVRVERAGFQNLELAVRLDYRQPVNQQTFALKT